MSNFAVLDIETTGLNRYTEDINFIGVLLDQDGILTCHVYSSSEFENFVVYVQTLHQNRTRLVWQNGKFDTLFIEHHLGLKLPIHDDIMVMGTAYDLDAKHGLKSMAKQYLKADDWDIGKSKKTSSDKSTVVPYLKKDLKYTRLLYLYFSSHLDATQQKLYKNLLLPAYKMYRNVERKGIYLDMKSLTILKRSYTAKKAECLSVLERQYSINWNATGQVADVFFNKLKLPTLKLSEKTGKPSADAKTLKRLYAKTHNELIQQLLEYKSYSGALSKFLEPWPKYTDAYSRIHPSFSLVNVVTGRTSCSDPNLQQVPRKKELRALYTATKGRVLIEADYSQLELRIAADYANEPTMLKIYKEGGDIHTETAMAITGKSSPSHEDRTRAKPVNFGFLYGMSARGFLNYAYDNYGVVFTIDEATRYRDLFFAKYAGLLPWHARMAEECELRGGVDNKFGRFRALPDIYSSDAYDKSKAARRAINTPVQGTGSDLLIGAATEIDSIITSTYDAYIVGTIHDSILADCPEKYAEQCCKTIQKIMAHPKILDDFGVNLKVPLLADAAIGPWGSK